jgi:hypothetical protein
LRQRVSVTYSQTYNFALFRELEDKSWQTLQVGICTRTLIDVPPESISCLPVSIWLL